METKTETFINNQVNVMATISSINNRLDTLQATVIKIDLATTNLIDDIKSLNKVINGNGNPENGLIVRLDRIEQSKVHDLPVRMDRIEKEAENRKWFLNTVVGAVIVSIISAIYNLFSIILKH